MKGFKITQSITDRQDASMGLYLKDVSKQPLLTPEQEVELSKRVKEGDKVALNDLVRANLRFVVSVAKSYQNQGLPLVDLIQEGNLGLIEAAKRYDEARGYKFISYAVWWIRQSILQALGEKSRTVRVPMSQISIVGKINKASDKFEQEYKRKPSVEELSAILGIDPEKIAVAIESISRAVSLETPFGDEEAGCLLDVIPNENSSNSDEYSSRNDLSNSIELALSSLPFRERDILRMLFGIGMCPMQDDEIANRFGIGRERVRQIRKEALKTLAEEYGDILKEFL